MTPAAETTRPTALLVDDEVVFREFFQKALATHFGLDAMAVPSFQEAKKALADKRFDLVITDLLLRSTTRETSGFDVIEEVRRTQPDTPVIVASAFAANYLEELGRLGVYVVDKKAGIQSLRHAVEAARGRVHQSAASRAVPEPVGEAMQLDDVRKAFADEAKKLLDQKERLLSVPGEGQFAMPKALQGFKPDIERRLLKYPYAKNVFLMMKFRDGNKLVAEYIAETLRRKGFNAVRGDDPNWNITSNVYNAVAALFCCKFGIALFD